MISVIIPLYNKEKQIAEALRSVIKQTYQDFEIIVVNDGSTDGSLEEASKVDDSRIKIYNQSNGGVSRARNKGIELAKGEYIAFLDADDAWAKDYLTMQMELVQNYPDCAVFATGYRFSEPNGHLSDPIIRLLHIDDDSGVVDNYFEICSCSHPLVTSISVLIRRDAIREVGGFPVGVASGEDLLTWARLICRYRLAFTKRVGAVYNLGEGYDYTKKPPRRQDKGDPVGQGLKALLQTYPSIKGLRSYIARWHKMRASVALRYLERGETLKEALCSLRYAPLHTETYPFLVLPLLPKPFIFFILKAKASK